MRRNYDQLFEDPDELYLLLLFVCFSYTGSSKYYCCSEQGSE